jgi:hypothetical protein
MLLKTRRQINQELITLLHMPSTWAHPHETKLCTLFQQIISAVKGNDVTLNLSQP